MKLADGFLYSMLVICLAAILVLIFVAESRTDHALRICKETGGKALVTEYNSKTGLTLNCFYNEFNNPTDQAEEFENL